MVTSKLEIDFIGLSRGSVSMAEHIPVAMVRQASTWSIAWGILLTIFGILAVGSPFLATVARRLP